jgi:hypothetical protein
VIQDRIILFREFTVTLRPAKDRVRQAILSNRKDNNRLLGTRNDQDQDTLHSSQEGLGILLTRANNLPHKLDILLGILLHNLDLTFLRIISRARGNAKHNLPRKLSGVDNLGTPRKSALLMTHTGQDNILLVDPGNKDHRHRSSKIELKTKIRKNPIRGSILDWVQIRTNYYKFWLNINWFKDAQLFLQKYTIKY